MRPRFASKFPPSLNRGRRECRARDAPEASCANDRRDAHAVSTGPPDQPGIPRAMVLTAYFELSPVTGLVCHRHLRLNRRELDASVGAPGPHGFAVRFRTPFVYRQRPRPPHPAPTFVTIATRPSVGRETATAYRSDLGKTRSGIFLQPGAGRGRFRLICPSGKIIDAHRRHAREAAGSPSHAAADCGGMNCRGLAKLLVVHSRGDCHAAQG